jgi:hypothetical protein
MRKSIQTLLSTTITRPLGLCGYVRDCRAIGTFRTQRRSLAALAA